VQAPLAAKQARLTGTLLQRRLDRRHTLAKLGFQLHYPLLELRDFVHLSSFMRT
jgi:hypothetical protein